MRSPLPYDPGRFAAAAAALIAAAAQFAARGWTPATSSNFSVRLDPAHAAITVSGRDKGRLTRADLMVINMNGQAVGSAQKPSAETALHTQLYHRNPAIGCVLHTHSRIQTVASRLFADTGVARLHDYELLKAFAGSSTHDFILEVPVLPNSQDMTELVRQVGTFFDRDQPLYGYLIAGHGLYTWGANLTEASRHLEAFEFLLGCELDLLAL